MISKIFKFGKQKGSSLLLPANGLGGSRAASLLVAHFALQNTASNPAEKNRAPLFSGINSAKQAGKKEGGWGEGPEGKPLASDGVKIFALLRLRLERFRFPLIKRKAETHQLNYHALRAYDLGQSHHALGACVSRGSVQKRLEFQPKGTVFKKAIQSV